MAPGRPPGNWTEGEGEASDLLLDLYDCKRFSLGGFERPARFVFDLHNKGSPPPDCRKGDWDLLWTVEAVYVDSPEIAEFLRNVYGMPATAADITLDHQITNGVRTHHWAWQPQGGLQSDVDALAIDDEPSQSTRIYRLAWITDGAVTMLDMDNTYDSIVPENPIQHGTMRSPMTYAEFDETFVGHGNILRDTNVEGTIHRFSDELCKEPIDPWP